MLVDRKRAHQEAMVNGVTGSARTRNAPKYIQQLCKHWSHKIEIERSGETALVRFATGVATMVAGAKDLIVTIRAEDEATVERLKEVVASHLDRFAFREAPLPFEWSVIEGGAGLLPTDQVG